MGRDLILTGLPRSGTTLACRLLGACADTVALAEPMDVEAIPAAPGQAVEHVLGWFEQTRRDILATGVAPSKVGPGGLVDNPFSSGDGPRTLLVREGTLSVHPTLTPDFTLVVKHNAAFTALLPELARRLETVAIVRHPLATLASWASLSLPVSRGRLPAGEHLDPVLALHLDQEPDLLRRQLRILAWFFERYQGLPPGNVVRYEDVMDSAGGILVRAAGLPVPEGGAPLRNRNARPQCAPSLLPRLADALAAQPGAWSTWYPGDTLEPVLAAMVAS